MSQQFLLWFELFFWDMAIQALSKSRLTQACLRRAYQVMHMSGAAWLGVLVSLTGIAGLFAGCLFYFLVNAR